MAASEPTLGHSAHTCPTACSTSRAPQFAYLTSAGTSASTYYDQVNSRGGNLSITCNIITAYQGPASTQPTQFFLQDDFNAGTESSTTLQLDVVANAFSGTPQAKLTGSSNKFVVFYVPTDPQPPLLAMFSKLNDIANTLTNNLPRNLPGFFFVDGGDPPTNAGREAAGIAILGPVLTAIGNTNTNT